MTETEQIDQKQNIAYISLASVLSAIAVVYLHVNECFWTYSSEGYWFSANIIESVAYFAVPVFFMISGATLIDFYERYDLKEYAVKRIKKTVLPYVVWSLLGLAFQIWVLKTAVPSTFNLKRVFGGFLKGDMVSVFWFFNTLFCIYLTIPLFAAVEKSKRKTVFLLVVCSTILFNYVIPFMITVCNLYGIQVPYAFHMNIGSGYLIYVLLGWLLTHCEIPRPLRWLIYALGMCGLVIHITGTWKLSTAAGEIVPTFKGYTNIPCLFYSMAVFIWIRYAGSKLLKRKWLDTVVRYLAGYTFGIYLLHWFIKELMIKIFSIDITGLAYRILAPVAIIIIAVLMTKVIRRIPLLREIVPK